MSEPPVIRIIINLSGMSAFLWLIWRSLRTGMPAGNPKMNPRRDERPLQFWMVVALFALGAVISGSRLVDL